MHGIQFLFVQVSVLAVAIDLLQQRARTGLLLHLSVIVSRTLSVNVNAKHCFESKIEVHENPYLLFD
jgi:hypothetical protein